MQSGSDRGAAPHAAPLGKPAICRPLPAGCARRSIEPALTTDIIVGFPGETEDDFLATCQVAEEVGFSKIHIFPFSARRGTPAAEMPDQVRSGGESRAGGPAGRARSGNCAAAISADWSAAACECWSNRPRPSAPGWLAGTACRYAPVHLPAGELDEPGKLVDLAMARPSRATGRSGGRQRPRPIISKRPLASSRHRRNCLRRPAAAAARRVPPWRRAGGICYSPAPLISVGSRSCLGISPSPFRARGRRALVPHIQTQRCRRSRIGCKSAVS